MKTHPYFDQEETQPNPPQGFHGQNHHATMGGQNVDDGQHISSEDLGQQQDRVL